MNHQYRMHASKTPHEWDNDTYERDDRVGLACPPPHPSTNTTPVYWHTCPLMPARSSTSIRLISAHPFEYDMVLKSRRWSSSRPPPSQRCSPHHLMRATTLRGEARCCDPLPVYVMSMLVHSCHTYHSIGLGHATRKRWPSPTSLLLLTHFGSHGRTYSGNVTSAALHVFEAELLAHGQTTMAT
ncbi:hypothetical protein BD779DRAFT_818666 [Infundibulicybe gibba]|nr:hypothetical protein BD779DRAFT_818666 [Infundibulicybe gibba]